MKKKLLSSALALALTLGLSACGTPAAGNSPTPSASPSATPAATPSATAPAGPVKETFAAEYEMKGTTSSGKPKNDTFIFEGVTEDGVITELNFDIIRNKGTDGAYSKKDIMGYLMNISDAAVEKSGDGYKLAKLSSYGYDTAYAEGAAAQFMVSASIDTLTDATTFQELAVVNDAYSTPDNVISVPLDKALIAFSYLAREAGIQDFSGETLVKDLLAPHGLYAGGSFVEGSKRVSFAGFNGGRSYGEQIDAIVAHILENKMTLDDVYTMFQTVNQPSTPIPERDAISGATISFVGDFQRMTYVAIHGELFEGVVTHSVSDGNTTVEVATQGYAGEVETHVTFDSTGKITSIVVRDANETPEFGGKLTAEDSDFIKALIAGQDNPDAVDSVSGATSTSNALRSAVKYAVEYYKGL